MGSTRRFKTPMNQAACYRQQQLIINANIRPSRIWSVSGYGVFNTANADTGTINTFPSIDPYDIGKDYGRAVFDVRYRFFLFGNLSLPHAINVSPLMIFSAGTPYNITTGSDLNRDGQYNDRPMFGAPNGIPAGTPGTNTIAGCGSFVSPPRGHGLYADSDQLLHRTESVHDESAHHQDVWFWGINQRSGPGTRPGWRSGWSWWSGRSGRPRRRPRWSRRWWWTWWAGGGPGGGFGGGGSTGKRYNLAFGVQILNLFNNLDLSTPNGTLTSQQFGRSTQLAGRPFTTNSALRQFSLQTSFNF